MAFTEQAGIYEGKAINADGFYALAEQANGQMGDLLARLVSLTDTLCGSQPEKAATSQSVRSVPNGHFDHAADNCRQMLGKIEYAHALISRIESKL